MIDQLKQTLKKFREAMDKKITESSPFSNDSFLLYKIITESNIDDLNNLEQPGFYYIDSNSITKIKNTPPDIRSCIILVLRYGVHDTPNHTHVTIQVAFSVLLGNSEILFRQMNNPNGQEDVWLNWQQIQTTEVQTVSSDEESSDESMEIN